MVAQYYSTSFEYSPVRTLTDGMKNAPLRDIQSVLRTVMELTEKSDAKSTWLQKVIDEQVRKGESATSRKSVTAALSYLVEVLRLVTIKSGGRGSRDDIGLDYAKAKEWLESSTLPDFALRRLPEKPAILAPGEAKTSEIERANQIKEKGLSPSKPSIVDKRPQGDFPVIKRNDSSQGKTTFHQSTISNSEINIKNEFGGRNAPVCRMCHQPAIERTVFRPPPNPHKMYARPSKSEYVQTRIWVCSNPHCPVYGTDIF